MNHQHHHIKPAETPREYAKFGVVIAGIIAVSLLLDFFRDGSLSDRMANFMAVFFLTFSAFKLINLEMFVITYRGYDILAKRLPFWAWILPFVELALGLGYLLAGGSMWLNVATIVITGLGSIGVAKELLSRTEIKCACLGTVIRLPLSKISLVENLAMFLMAVAMLAI